VTLRADVGGGGLSGALMMVFILIQDRSLCDFNILVASLTTVFVFLAGYMPQLEEAHPWQSAGRPP
jgi:hypothetical protein